MNHRWLQVYFKTCSMFWGKQSTNSHWELNWTPTICHNTFCMCSTHSMLEVIWWSSQEPQVWFPATASFLFPSIYASDIFISSWSKVCQCTYLDLKEQKPYLIIPHITCRDRRHVIYTNHKLLKNILVLNSTNVPTSSLCILKTRLWRLLDTIHTCSVVGFK